MTMTETAYLQPSWRARLESIVRSPTRQMGRTMLTVAGAFSLVVAVLIGVSEFRARAPQPEDPGSTEERMIMPPTSGYNG